jgi:hypothetical protein
MGDRAELDGIVAEMSKKLADQGKLIEAGWIGYRLAVVPTDAPQIQLDECKMAFMAGASHLFSSIMVILDPGDEPSAADLNKMELIHKELDDFAQKMKLKVTKTEGSA